MKNSICLRNLFLSAMVVSLCVLLASCDKDPEFESGDYHYHNGLVKLDNVNGILIEWNGKVDEAHKNLVRELVSNMVRVEGGTFMMGAQSSDENAANYDAYSQYNENPVHEVSLSDFYIGKYEITQYEYSVIMNDGQEKWSSLYGLGDNIPAYNISYKEVCDFVRELNKLSSVQFDVPSEAQWEFAARGGKASNGYHYSGGDNLDEVAWYQGNAGRVLHNVGEKAPNELGLYDMSGNVWEWCRDTYGLYTANAEMNPESNYSDLMEGYNSLRGGGFAHFANSSRVTARDKYYYENCSISNGVRLILKKN